MQIREMGTAEARSHISDIVNRAAFGNEITVITRYGKPICAIVPMHIYQEIERKKLRFPAIEVVPQLTPRR